MPWPLKLTLALALLPLSVGLFFYAFTKGALLLRRLRRGPPDRAAHVYPLYSRMWLIRLVDRQPIISAILLFQYDRLVSWMVDELRRMDLQGQDVLITSCAFGNVMPRVVAAAQQAGARQIRIVDIVDNELVRARDKLKAHAAQLHCAVDDATTLSLPTACVAANVMFFLLHELEPGMKRQAITEAARVLAPGGKLLLAEFHKPGPRLLRAMSWLYFKTFEPYGLALWDLQDPLAQLSALPGMRCERRLALFGNFQLIVATRRASD